jgi:hypothetical protein
MTLIEDWTHLTLSLHRGTDHWLWADYDDDDDYEDDDFPAVLRDSDGRVPERIVLPAHAEICDTCRGAGTRVDPAIDGHGLSMSDPDLDDSFWDDYGGGSFDVSCGCRDGKVLVLDIDDSNATLSAVHVELSVWAECEYESSRIAAQERQAGA